MAGAGGAGRAGGAAVSAFKARQGRKEVAVSRLARPHQGHMTSGYTSGPGPGSLTQNPEPETIQSINQSTNQSINFIIIVVKPVAVVVLVDNVGSTRQTVKRKRESISG